MTLKKSDLSKWKTTGLERLLENSPYRNRGEALGNNQTITYVFEILHERDEIDCETAYYFNCPKEE